MRTWVAVESLSNWVADQENDFQFLGVAPSRVATAREVRVGDLVFMYLSRPTSAFSDVRIVAAEGLHKSPHTAKYDVECHHGILTRSALLPAPAARLKFREMQPDLAFCRNPFSALRASFRRIGKPDARVLYERFLTREPSLRSEELDRLLIGAELGA